MVKESIDNLVGFSNSLIPILITLMITTGSIASSSILQPILLFMITFIGNFIKDIIIPVVLVSTALGIVSKISSRLQIDKLSKFFKSSVVWILGVVLTCLCLEIPHEKIIEGLGNFKGIAGRTNKKVIEKSIIIEEINPGINTQAIKESVNMIDNIDDYYVSIGGDYGITCEEIDEEKLCDFLDTLDCELILTGDVGNSIMKKLTRNATFIRNYPDCYTKAIENNKNLLFIYRSNYSKISQR